MAIDLKKTLDAYQAKRGEFRLVEVPPTQYLIIDGSGDPNTSQEFSDAMTALFPLAYGLKFASKRELGIDTVVMPLEGLWHAPDMEAFTTRRDTSSWLWTLMIMVPEHVTPTMFDEAKSAAAAKKDASPHLPSVRFETLDEGLCVQTLHVGPFDDEGPVLDDLHHRFVPENGLAPTGRHHEIYLSDFRRVDPAKLRTILRQPVVRTT
ncbi:GyrI-like domain-containing protein [Microbacterium sp. 179-I 3D4 NHS]|uniref:GyrI-like domain-containing protein n=1 Tax=Microbacterium sp. 179-I 3D4 NHS TaxID=3142381 RepID=UPI00399F771B